MIADMTMSALALNVQALRDIIEVAPDSNTRALSTLAVENFFSQVRRRCPGLSVGCLQFAQEHSKVAHIGFASRSSDR